MVLKSMVMIGVVLEVIALRIFVVLIEKFV